MNLLVVLPLVNISQYSSIYILFNSIFLPQPFPAYFFERVHISCNQEVQTIDFFFSIYIKCPDSNSLPIIQTKKPTLMSLSFRLRVVTVQR